MLQSAEPAHRTETPAPSARVLVVDDNALNRSKLRLAVQGLGHQAEVATNGVEALDHLRQTHFDAVLLDIVMPEMDGFDVLALMKADDVLRDVPVIVVSALDDETESVVRAIELGAEDFLPKTFDLVLLKARLGASLTKKRFRDQEKEYFARVERLMEAAALVEAGRFNPRSLELDELAERADPLGRLAAVFRGMAEEIYLREMRLRRAIQMLQGSLLVIAVGIAWGLTPSLSRIAAKAGATPLGLAVWVNLVAAILCLAVAAYRGKLPRLTPREFLFFVGWAVIAGILQRLTTFFVTAHVQAAMLSLIVTLQGFMVFAFAAVARLEKATPRRLLGLGVGLVGVAGVLMSNFDMTSASQNAWLLFALLLPFLFAVEAVYLAARRPVHVDMFAAVGIMMGISAVLLAPLAYGTGQLMLPSLEIDRVEMVTVLMGIVGMTSLVLAFHLISTAGPVFASQSAYAMTLAGIVWGMLLLGEELSLLTWAAFGIIAVGMYLVEPKVGDQELILRRNFHRAG